MRVGVVRWWRNYNNGSAETPPGPRRPSKVLTFSLEFGSIFKFFSVGSMRVGPLMRPKFCCFVISGLPFSIPPHTPFWGLSCKVKFCHSHVWHLGWFSISWRHYEKKKVPSSCRQPCEWYRIKSSPMISWKTIRIKGRKSYRLTCTQI